MPSLKSLSSGYIKTKPNIFACSTDISFILLSVLLTPSVILGSLDLGYLFVYINFKNSKSVSKFEYKR